MKKNTTKVIKEANKYLVMQCIQAFEPVTLEKIAEKTLLSRPTILEIINSFKEEGIVVNGGFRESTGGRPPQLLCINGDSAYAIGIDFEFPTIRIALANAKREIVGRRKILFKIDTQAEEVLARMLRELEHLLEEFSSVRPGSSGSVSGFAERFERQKADPCTSRESGAGSMLNCSGFCRKNFIFRFM